MTARVINREIMGYLLGDQVVLTGRLSGINWEIKCIYLPGYHMFMQSPLITKKFRILLLPF